MADQMLAKGDGKEPKLTIEQSLSRYVSNSDLSDVCFLVGDQREKIYAHRVFLAIESEVFKSMFYGEMKETSYEIEVPDLDPVGFRNMMKYFYTKKVEEIDFSEIHPTYMAANKYLALGLIQDLTDYLVKNCLEAANSCVLYEQLLKLAISNSLTFYPKTLIAVKFSEACASDSFKQIGEDTLVAILKFNMLYTTEFELLKACLRWTDSEVARRSSGADQASKRTIFEPIKHLIRFGDLSLSDFSSIPEIGDYLTVEEIGSIFLHLSHRYCPIQIVYRSPRVPRKSQVAKAVRNNSVSGLLSTFLELRASIKVNKIIRISSIKTFAALNCSSFNFEICSDGKPLSLKARTSPIHAGGSKSYTIHLPLLPEPDAYYELRFSFSFEEPRYVLGTSSETTLRSDENGESGVVFGIESGLGYHCIESIDFTGPFF